MRIEICDRASIENLASTPFEPDTALISIADYGDSLVSTGRAAPARIQRFADFR